MQAHCLRMTEGEDETLGKASCLQDGNLLWLILSLIQFGICLIFKHVKPLFQNLSNLGR